MKVIGRGIAGEWNTIIVGTTTVSAIVIGTMTTDADTPTAVRSTSGMIATEVITTGSR